MEWEAHRYHFQLINKPVKKYRGAGFGEALRVPDTHDHLHGGGIR